VGAVRALLGVLDKILTLIIAAALSVAAVVTLLVALVGTIDILTTRAFDQAIPGAFELSSAGLVLMVFLGLGQVTRGNEHIRVDILLGRMSPRLRQACRVLALTCTAVFLWLMTVQMLSLAKKSWSVTEVANGLLPFPIYPIKLAAFAGLGLAFIAAVRLLARAVIDLLSPMESQSP
jgi:TRAP-type C4-dicarboxylate transport system permease small subunit